jgi:hypothetical protein
MMHAQLSPMRKLTRDRNTLPSMATLCTLVSLAKQGKYTQTFIVLPCTILIKP